MFRVWFYGLLAVYGFQFYAACPPEYRVIDPNHSFCSREFPGAVEQRVSSSERAHILHLHNYERRLVRGTNMEKMYWNDDLANVALHYALACIFDHDKSSERSVPKIPLSTGQNLAMGYENWTQAIHGWIEEKEHYFHGYPASGIVGHYTQMIWHSAVLVGCGAAMCPAYGPYENPWPFYVCNYITGQLNSNIYPPYDPGHSDRPLHDCQGQVCLYNGSLDLNNCQCRCSSYASGEQCERLNCGQLPPCPYQSPSSCIAVNVPLECPRLCGLCERYEVLKQVYGEQNLAPNRPIALVTKPRASSTPTKRFSTTTKKTILRKLKNKLRNRTHEPAKRILPTTIVTSTTLASDSAHLYLSAATLIFHVSFYCIV